MDSLNTVFQRAVTESRGKYLHLNLAEQYERARDFAGAAAIFERAMKKHKKSKKVGVDVGLLLSSLFSILS